MLSRLVFILGCLALFLSLALITSQGNRLPTSFGTNSKVYGSSGNDNFEFSSDKTNQDQKIMDLNNNDKIVLSNYYVGTQYKIQMENLKPVIYQDYGVNGKYKVVEVGGSSERLSKVTQQALDDKNEAIFLFK
jgi:Ca2+-binding RTX toxin-like protein